MSHSVHSKIKNKKIKEQVGKYVRVRASLYPGQLELVLVLLLLLLSSVLLLRTVLILLTLLTVRLLRIGCTVFIVRLELPVLTD